jgi:hypothetical protein
LPLTEFSKWQRRISTQVIAELMMHFKDLNDDMKEKILSILTFRDLYCASGNHIRVFEQYQLRSKRMAAELVQEALMLLPAPLVRTSSRIIDRAFKEWKTAPRAATNFKMKAICVLTGQTLRSHSLMPGSL